LKTRQLALLLLIVFAPTVWAQEQDGCRDVLELTGKDHSVDDLEVGVSTYVHSRYCDGTSEKSGVNFDSGASLILDAIPMSGFLKGNSSQETVRNFCRQFDSEFKLHERHYVETSIAVSDAIHAWQHCKELAGLGVLFYPQVTPTQFTAGLKRKQNLSVKVTGISYDHDLMKCTAMTTGPHPTRITLDENTVVDLTEKNWNVTCKRIGKVVGDNTIYPQADVVVETDAANAFTWTIPADVGYSFEFSSQVLKEFGVLKTQLAKQQDRHYTIVWDDPVTLNDIGHTTPVVPPGNWIRPKSVDLGKHDIYDICVVSDVNDQKVGPNSETKCEVSLGKDGIWKLTVEHTWDSDTQSSQITCVAKCGRIQ
jgi:hypothetical protein